MQGFERTDGQPLDAAALAGHLIPAGSMFAFLATHRAEVFPDAGYVDLFAPPGVGRPSLPAAQMAAVMALHNYSDRETAEAFRFDVRWKAAAGAPLDDPGFDPSSLVYWRNRIAKSERPHRINDAVKKVAGQTGILKGRRRAVDSTILADAVVILSPLWGVSHVALRAFELRGGRVILSGVYDAPEAMLATWPASISLSLRF